MNVYENCKDSGFLMLPDRVNDMICCEFPGATNRCSVLGMQDRSVRGRDWEMNHKSICMMVKSKLNP